MQLPSTQPILHYPEISPTLYVAWDASCFVAPGGELVSLLKRVPLRRIFAALVDRARRYPVEPLQMSGVFLAGWPGEYASSRAVAARVYTGVLMLRNLGLRGILVRRNSGYILDARFLPLEDAWLDRRDHEPSVE